MFLIVPNFDFPSQELKETENRVLITERILLHTLCFDLQVTHPYQEALQIVKTKLKRKCPFKILIRVIKFSHINSFYPQ